jgi:hypothetical protein
MDLTDLRSTEYRPFFSGHETFPPRYGWLRKGYEAVRSSPSAKYAKSLFSRDDSIALFGVGKNMVASIRHWCEATGVIAGTEDGEGLEPTPFGDFLLGPRGIDPYLESDAAIWLIHWRIAANPRLTTWHWTFNQISQSAFSRSELADELLRLSAARSWSRVSQTTVRRDVECLVRTYVGGRGSAWSSHEETADSPLAELGLIRPQGSRDRFQMVRGAKPTLPASVLAFGLAQFFRGRGAAQTATLESLTYDAYSPGRIFLLAERELTARLQSIEADSGGAFRWSETAGLKQVVQIRQLEDSQALKLIEEDVRGQSVELATA